MIFQDPTTSLNPCFTVGFPDGRDAALHLGMTKAARANARSSCSNRSAFPHPRAAWASTAPDVGRHEPARDDCHGHRLQPESSDRRRAHHRAGCDHPGADSRPAAHLQKDRNMALVLITHNMGVVSEMAQRIAVMYAGQIMEERSAHDICSSGATPTPRRCWLPCRSAATVPRAWRPFRAWCQVCTTARKAVCFRRAASTPTACRDERPDCCVIGKSAWCAAMRRARCHASEGSPHERRHQTYQCPRRLFATGGGRARPEAGLQDQPWRISPGRPACRPWVACRLPSTQGKRWLWWASPVAASPRWRGWCR
jgi:hypothetical protein